MGYWLDQFHIFLLILLRVSALLIVAPIFGHRLFLARAKVGLAVMVSMVVFPLVDGFDVPEGFFPYAVMMAGEVILGLVLGWVWIECWLGLGWVSLGFGLGVDLVRTECGMTIHRFEYKGCGLKKKNISEIRNVAAR